MKVNGKDYRTVWQEGSSVFLIKQTKLPFKFEVYEAKDHLDTCDAIKTMIVRGAGAIGATAGYAMAQAICSAEDYAIRNKSEQFFRDRIEKAKKDIESTRPTAQNLFYAIARVFQTVKKTDLGKRGKAAKIEAQKIADEDAEACKKIGEYGNELIQDGFNIETHCNAGWLAFVDHGSALSPVYAAHRSGKNVFVFVDETRPRGQGARLTAWELYNECVPHAIIADNAGAHYMSKGKINIMIVGADRIARNGDTANKIGTLEKAIVAHEFGVPFYIAAPTSTIDLKCASGEEIPIEERSQNEVLYQEGPEVGLTLDTGLTRTIRVCSPGSEALNPAFDVTPAKYIRGIITEKGIVKPNEREIRKLFS